MNKFAFWSLVAVLGAALGWGIAMWSPAPQAVQGTEALRLAAPPTGGDFTLESPEGPLSLRDLRGNVVLLYFGYTFCPDVCPTSLAWIAQALSTLDEQELSRVRVLFISVDPERDTLPRLKEYAAYFHDSIIGVTGSREAIDHVARLYGAAYSRQAVDSAGGYVVDHSSFTYVISPQGVLLESLPHGTPPPQIAAAIRGALKS